MSLTTPTLGHRRMDKYDANHSVKKKSPSVFSPLNFIQFLGDWKSEY